MSLFEVYPYFDGLELQKSLNTHYQYSVWSRPVFSSTCFSWLLVPIFWLMLWESGGETKYFMMSGSMFGGHIIPADSVPTHCQIYQKFDFW